jgi:hypothetical protein
MSPRLMGEVTLGAGRIAGGINTLPLAPMGRAAF